MWSSAGSVSGWSLRWWAPRLSSRARQEAAIRRASGNGSSSSSRRPAGSRCRPAWRHSAARVSSGGGSGADRRRPGAACRGRLGLVERGQRGAAAEHEALGERVRRQPVGAVQAGAGALADRVEAGQRTSARRGRWPRRPSCSAPRGRPGRGRGAGRCPTSSSAAATLGKRARSTERMSRPTAAVPLRSQLRLDRERDLVARRELVDEALAVGVEQRRALAADRLGDQEAVARAVAAQRGGVELHELEVGQRGAGGVGEQQPGADRAARVGGALPERGHAAGGEHHARGRARAAASPRRGRATSPTQRPSCVGQRGGRAGLEHLDALVGGGAARTARA